MIARFAEKIFRDIVHQVDKGLQNDCSQCGDDPYQDACQYKHRAAP